jgi:hypothetical protein
MYVRVPDEVEIVKHKIISSISKKQSGSGVKIYVQMAEQQ